MLEPGKPTTDTIGPAQVRRKKTRRGFIEVGLILAGMVALFAGMVAYTFSYL